MCDLGRACDEDVKRFCGCVTQQSPLSNPLERLRYQTPPISGTIQITMCLAAPARVLSISDGVATVDYGGVETSCRLDTLTEKVAVGDYVLIHTGFAIRRLAPEDGEETLRLFDELSASLREAEAENLPSADSPAGEQSNSQRATSLREAEKASQTPSGPGRNQAPTDSADDEPAKPETLGS